MNLTFESIVNPCDGYGSSAEQIALSLSEHEDVSSIFYKSVEKDNEKNIDLLQEETKILLHGESRNEVYLGYYSPTHSLRDKSLTDSAAKAKRRYIYTTWESTSPPKEWAEHINLFDKLFVSCEMCKQAFKSIGVTIPVSIVPLGVDEKLWPYKKRERSGRPLRFFTFANADWNNYRKNFSLAFKAFRDCFGSRNDVELWIKVKSKDGIPAGVAYHVSKFDNVKIVEGDLNQLELLNLLYDVDCLIFPSRGEGFGLPVREAMSTGIPVIAANWGGMYKPMSQSFNYSLNYKFVNYKSDTGENLGYYVDPSEEHLKEILTHISRFPDELIENGLSCAKWVRENETYEITAKKIVEEMI